MPSSSLTRTFSEFLREQAGRKYLAHFGAFVGRVYATSVPSVWTLLSKSVLVPSTAVQQNFVYRATLGNLPLLRYTDNSQPCAHLRRPCLAPECSPDCSGGWEMQSNAYLRALGPYCGHIFNWLRASRATDGAVDLRRFRRQRNSRR